MTNPTLFERAKSLNSKIFSQLRLSILSILSAYLEDGITYRDFKTALMVSDGALYSNIKALEAMGYVSSDKVKVENKTLERYRITEEGLRAFINVKQWLVDLIKEVG